MRAAFKKTVYGLSALLLVLGMLFLTGCSGQAEEKPSAGGPDWSTLSVSREVPLRFAEEYRLTEYGDGYTLLTIGKDQRFLIVREGHETPRGLDDGISVLNGPVERVYLAATSAMDFFRALDAVGTVRLSGTDIKSWYGDRARCPERREEPGHPADASDARRRI